MFEGSIPSVSSNHKPIQKMGYMKQVMQMCQTKIETQANIEVLKATISMCEHKNQDKGYFYGEEWTLMQLKGILSFLTAHLEQRKTKEKKYDPLYRERTTN